MNVEPLYPKGTHHGLHLYGFIELEHERIKFEPPIIRQIDHQTALR